MCCTGIATSEAALGRGLARCIPQRCARVLLHHDTSIAHAAHSPVPPSSPPRPIIHESAKEISCCVCTILTKITPRIVQYTNNKKNSWHPGVSKCLESRLSELRNIVSTGWVVVICRERWRWELAASSACQRFCNDLPLNATLFRPPDPGGAETMLTLSHAGLAAIRWHSITLTLTDFIILFRNYIFVASNLIFVPLTHSDIIFTARYSWCH